MTITISKHAKEAAQDIYCSATIGFSVELTAKRVQEAINSAEAEAWQPIRTAPRDGSYILLWGGLCYVGWWADVEWWPMFGDDKETVHPTHWRPLSKPPERE